MTEVAGGSVPQIYQSKWSPISAWEWGNANSSYLTNDNCWSLVTGCYKRGDVTALSGHVGIVTGDGESTYKRWTS